MKPALDIFSKVGRCISMPGSYWTSSYVNCTMVNQIVCVCERVGGMKKGHFVATKT